MFITGSSLVSSIGPNLGTAGRAIINGQSGLAPVAFDNAGFSTFIGRVDSVDTHRLPSRVYHYDCRNNRLADLALRSDGFSTIVTDAADRYGPHRIGTIIGTTTSGVEAGEEAFVEHRSTGRLPTWFDYVHTADHYSVSAYVADVLELAGPAYSISTACSSSAKVFADAMHLIELGICDAVVVGGVDSLSGMTIYGFQSLGLLSNRPCRPADADRDGISIGEAAGFALIERESTDASAAFAKLLGCGESCDAYHMAAPDPDGCGAELAMAAALADAGVTASAVDYVNAHGTGTRHNDASEDLAIVRVFGTEVPVSSTKGWTGHTLGAAGIVNVLLTITALREGILPGTLNLERRDPQLRSNVVYANTSTKATIALCNAFGFGGNNCSVLLEIA